MDFPGKNTGVGCHSLLHGIFPAQGSNPRLLHLPLHQQADLPLCRPGSPALGLLIPKSIICFLEDPGGQRWWLLMKRSMPVSELLFLFWKAKHRISTLGNVQHTINSGLYSVQFTVSQSCPTLCDPHGLQHAWPPCPSPTPRVYPNSCPLSRWCHPTISSSGLYTEHERFLFVCLFL